MLKRTLRVAAFLFINQISLAQNAEQKDTVLSLEPVIITANKLEQEQRETGKVLTVISREELRQNSNQSLTEILNRKVGIMIGGSNSTPGSVQTVYLRGASAANTLIMLDGIPMHDPSGISSEFDLNTFLPSQLERVEVLKGAQSTLYGSDAVAGVINLISKKPDTKPICGLADFSAGSFGTVRGSLRLSGTLRSGLTYQAGYQKLRSDGISSAYDSSGSAGFDRDGVNQDAVTAGIGYQSSRNFSLQAYVKYNVSRASIDAGAFTDDRDYRYGIKNSVYGLRTSYLIPGGSIHFHYQFNDYTRTYNNDSGNIGGFSNDPFAFYFKYIDEKYRGVSHFAELYSNLTLTKGLRMVSGIEYRRQETSQDYFYISNYGPYQPLPLSGDSTHAAQWSAYGLMLLAKGGFRAEVGGRYNHHSLYGSNGTFSVNPSFTFSNSLKIFVNLASAYRVPSLYQLFSEYGNKDLKPEQSLSYELGAAFQRDLLFARVTFFRRKIRDVFAFYTDPVTFMGRYVNEDSQDDEGLEAEFSWKAMKNLTLTGNYTYVAGELTTSNGAGKDTSFFNLYRRPKNVLNIGADYTVKKLSLSALLRTSSATLEPFFNALPQTLPGYYTVDVHGAYGFNKRFSVFADIRNLTDQSYFDQWGFGTMGINFRMGLQASF